MTNPLESAFPDCVDQVVVSGPGQVQNAYRARDAHEAFFRPGAQVVKTKRKTTVKRKLFTQKQRSLTNKQRQARAHTHYIINHDSSSDAARFLCNERVKDIPTNTFNEIYRMCVNGSTSTTISPPAKPTPSPPPTTPCQNKKENHSKKKIVHPETTITNK